LLLNFTILNDKSHIFVIAIKVNFVQVLITI